jgi:hypothetical protein
MMLKQRLGHSLQICIFVLLSTFPSYDDDDDNEDNSILYLCVLHQQSDGQLQIQRTATNSYQHFGGTYCLHIQTLCESIGSY